MRRQIEVHLRLCFAKFWESISKNYTKQQSFGKNSPKLYPKILLTLDEDPEMSYDGIRKVNALDWLLHKTI